MGQNGMPKTKKVLQKPYQRFLKILPRFRPKPWNVLLETLEGFHEMLLNNRVIVAELPGHFCWFFWDSPQKHPCALKRKMLRLCGRLELGIRNLRDFTQ